MINIKKLQFCKIYSSEIIRSIHILLEKFEFWKRD